MDQPIRSARVAMALGLGAEPALAAGPSPAVPGATAHHARHLLRHARAVRPDPARPIPPKG